MKKSIEKSEFRPKKEGTYRWWLCSFDVKVRILDITEDSPDSPVEPLKQMTADLKEWKRLFYSDFRDRLFSHFWNYMHAEAQVQFKLELSPKIERACET